MRLPSGLLLLLLAAAVWAGERPVRVETAPVEARVLGLTLERPGTLAYRRLLRVHNQEEGRIERLPWYEGDRVKKGELLVQMDTRLLHSELRKAEADLRLKEKRLARLAKLERQKAASVDEVSEARTELEVARAELELLRTRLEYTRVTAPFDGIVLERLAEPGDVVNRHTHLLTLADPASLVVRFRLDGSLLEEVDPDGTVEVRAATARHTARIRRIHPRVDPHSRLGVVEAAFDAPPRGLRAGDYVRVRLQTRPRRRLLVPFRALRADRAGEYLFVVEGDRARRRPVRSGRRIGDLVEILEGVEAGTPVITRGFLGLGNGTSITVSEPEAGQGSENP